MKLKTIKSASKRIIKITSKGKLLRRAITSQHLAARKSKRTRKKSGRTCLVSAADIKNIKRLIPYK